MAQLRYPASAALVAIAVLLAVPAGAQDDIPPIDYFTNSPLLLGSEPPTLEITTRAELEDVELTVQRGSDRQSHSIGVLRPGDSATVALDVPVGQHELRAELQGRWTRSGEAFELSFTFDFEVTEGLELTVPLEDVDLAGRQLGIELNRPADRVEYLIVRDDGEAIGQGTVQLDGATPGTRLTIPWSQREGNVLKIVLLAYDTAGFWAEVELIPWHLEIPHEEINFESGSHAIPAHEAHKVDDAYNELLEAVERYGELVDVNLYVAGYTDTVGSNSDNQALSERRARAIAEAFRQRGFHFPIYYQGFGEDALAVSTPDGTDEVRNRRALYIVAAQPPLPSGQVPRDRWRPID